MATTTQPIDNTTCIAVAFQVFEHLNTTVPCNPPKERGEQFCMISLVIMLQHGYVQIEIGDRLGVITESQRLLAMIHHDGVVTYNGVSLVPTRGRLLDGQLGTFSDYVVSRIRSCGPACGPTCGASITYGS